MVLVISGKEAPNVEQNGSYIHCSWTYQQATRATLCSTVAAANGFLQDPISSKTQVELWQNKRRTIGCIQAASPFLGISS